MIKKYVKEYSITKNTVNYHKSITIFTENFVETYPRLQWLNLRPDNTRIQHNNAINSKHPIQTVKGVKIKLTPVPHLVTGQNYLHLVMYYASILHLHHYHNYSKNLETNHT